MTNRLKQSLIFISLCFSFYSLALPPVITPIFHFEGITIPDDIIFEKVILEDKDVVITGIQCKKKGRQKASKTVELYGHGFTSKAAFWVDHMLKVCKKGKKAFSFNHMEHGDDFDQIGRSYYKDKTKNLAAFDYFSNHQFKVYKYVKSKAPVSKIIYHGHSMGHMMYRTFISGYVKDLHTGEEKIDLKRKAWIEKNTHAAILHGGPSDLRMQGLMSKLLEKIRVDSKATELINKLLSAQSGPEKVKKTETFRSYMLKNLLTKGFEALKPALNKLTSSFLNLKNYNMRDFTMMLHHGASNRVSPEIVESFTKFSGNGGFVSEHGFKFHELNNTNIRQFLIFGKQDALASSARAAKNMVDSVPNSKQVFLLLDDYSHLDLASGTRYRKEILPLINEFIENGPSDELLEKISNTRGMSYIAGGKHLNAKCLRYLKAALNSGKNKFNLSRAQVKKLLEKANQ